MSAYIVCIFLYIHERARGWRYIKYSLEMIYISGTDTLTLRNNMYITTYSLKNEKLMIMNPNIFSYINKTLISAEWGKLGLSLWNHNFYIQTRNTLRFFLPATHRSFHISFPLQPKNCDLMECQGHQSVTYCKREV